MNGKKEFDRKYEKYCISNRQCLMWDSDIINSSSKVNKEDVFNRGMKMKNGKIKLRFLKNCEKDYRLLEKWYQEKEIYSHFEQRKLNYEEIKEKYFPRTLDNATIPVFMIEYNNSAIGIVQYQKINSQNKKLYDLDDINCYEIDIFIGELELHNKGIGKKTIDMISKYLFSEKNAELLVMCPLKENINAIKCYEKCGFKISKEFETEDTIGTIQKFLLMIKRK